MDNVKNKIKKIYVDYIYDHNYIANNSEENYKKNWWLRIFLNLMDNYNVKR